MKYLKYLKESSDWEYKEITNTISDYDQRKLEIMDGSEISLVDSTFKNKKIEKFNNNQSYVNFDQKRVDYNYLMVRLLNNGVHTLIISKHEDEWYITSFNNRFYLCDGIEGLKILLLKIKDRGYY